MPLIHLIFRSAKQEGKWLNTYAGKNANEYFATGGQIYFHSFNGYKPAGSHYRVDSREALLQYDPGLYSLLEEVYSCGPHGFIDRCHHKQSRSHNVHIHKWCHILVLYTKIRYKFHLRGLCTRIFTAKKVQFNSRLHKLLK